MTSQDPRALAPDGWVPARQPLRDGLFRFMPGDNPRPDYGTDAVRMELDGCEPDLLARLESKANAAGLTLHEMVSRQLEDYETESPVLPSEKRAERRLLRKRRDAIWLHCGVGPGDRYGYVALDVNGISFWMSRPAKLVRELTWGEVGRLKVGRHSPDGFEGLAAGELMSRGRDIGELAVTLVTNAGENGYLRLAPVGGADPPEIGARLQALADKALAEASSTT
ncbi:MAG: hypothetical protein LBJ62_11005 [Bifidobacteriaceae bacterium]|jgi:hypothetical protein|nr:hypothetical protein [Bifidobacteriaceae bacterium]